MTLETERLLLRPWRDTDAQALYPLAADPLVGPAAGWKVHTDVEDSRNIIQTVLAKEGTYAVTVKALGDNPVGSIGVFPFEGAQTPGEWEIGYWIGRPYWGQGYIPEAVKAVLQLTFSLTHTPRCWCAHFQGNQKSQRVIEKCGFSYQFTAQSGPWPSGGMRTTLFYSLTREKWEEDVR